MYDKDAGAVYDVVLISTGHLGIPSTTLSLTASTYSRTACGRMLLTGRATITEVDLYDATSDTLQTATGSALITAENQLAAAKG